MVHSLATVIPLRCNTQSCTANLCTTLSGIGHVHSGINWKPVCMDMAQTLFNRITWWIQKYKTNSDHAAAGMQSDANWYRTTDPSRMTHRGYECVSDMCVTTKRKVNFKGIEGYSCVTTKREGKTNKNEGKHQKCNSSQQQKERNSPTFSENEEIEAQQEQRGMEK